jgi:hypothetical protein
LTSYSAGFGPSHDPLGEAPSNRQSGALLYRSSGSGRLRLPPHGFLPLDYFDTVVQKMGSRGQRRAGKLCADGLFVVAGPRSVLSDCFAELFELLIGGRDTEMAEVVEAPSLRFGVEVGRCTG